MIGSPFFFKKMKLQQPLFEITEIHPAVKPNIIKSTPSLQSSVSKRMMVAPSHSALSILGKRNYSHHHNGLDGMYQLER